VKCRLFYQTAKPPLPTEFIEINHAIMPGRVKPPNSHVIRVKSGNATDDVNFMRLSYTDELNVKGSNLEKEAHSHIDISVQYMAFPVNSLSIFFSFPCCLFTFDLLPPPFPFFPPFLISLVFNPASILLLSAFHLLR
jgi:hypothetical protein